MGGSICMYFFCFFHTYNIRIILRVPLIKGWQNSKLLILKKICDEIYENSELQKYLSNEGR
jgi:hypothetical protein